MLIAILKNVLLVVRNLSRRLLRRPPEYVLLEVSGRLPEFRLREPFFRRLVARPRAGVTLEELRERLERIAADGRVRGVVLRVRGLQAGWAALEELRGEIVRFRERGGRVIAYLVDAGTRDYYLACAADEILAPPAATVSVTGVRTRVNFLKDALARFGVEGEVLAVSPYKSAGEVFTRTDFSPEAREQAERLLDRRYAELEEAVVEGRGMSPEEVRQKIDGAPYPARRALREGLLDGLAYEDELPRRLGGGVSIGEWERAGKALRLPYLPLIRGRVAVVGVTGVIVRGRSRRLPFPLPLLGDEQAGSESVIGALRRAEQSGSVRGVLLHVDSRGGDALASDLIWREVERIRRRKPVVVLMGETAASGGYYVSAGASGIVARRSTVTGSIGVLIFRPTAVGLYGRLGVNPVALERGARSGIMDPARRPGPDELAALEGSMYAIYSEFKDRVRRGREIEEGELEPLAGGRVWTGEEARERGLVDETGGFRAAVRRVAELAGIPPEAAERNLLHVPPQKKGHPEPGPVEGLLEAAGEVLREPRVWLLAPYELGE
ncbi:signal peptide peptidase SppA [Rubrobacter taiwanensis]|uniref:Signal peptide peptidase SppA n=1 Tax=Rubrobacter taiwanensis TaxID=185139 RepID=A0A4R1BHT1_9ACTN|nr:S49 family peptidase [Rubrobacter taiwanensis]TCJ16810.1 signal peptide peptidase SppA [Rubrobacter taiwanensis]